MTNQPEPDDGLREAVARMMAELTDDEEPEPLCDISGRCRPYDEDENQDIAMCRYCGGERYRDYPFPGNWGQRP